jgi:hypothetical protein
LFKKNLFFKKKKKKRREKRTISHPLGHQGHRAKGVAETTPKQKEHRTGDIERNLHYYIYRQAGQSLILFHFQQSFGLPNPPPFIPHFHTFPASMDQFLHLDSHIKPTTHP